jgi:hypothetical protein
MKSTNPSLVPAAVVVAALFMAGCAAPPNVNRTPRTVALIMSGDVVTYGSQGTGTRVSVVDVDGKPVKEPYGPVELTPGRHAVNLSCDGTNSPQQLTVKAGEVYQFATRANPGAKGCTGALVRVRSLNP